MAYLSIIWQGNSHVSVENRAKMMIPTAKVGMYIPTLPCESSSSGRGIQIWHDQGDTPAREEGCYGRLKIESKI
jgi:hypothetical protein